MNRGQETIVFLLLVLNLIGVVTSVTTLILVLRKHRDIKKSTVDTKKSTMEQLARHEVRATSPQRIQRSPLIGSEARREHYNS